MIITLIFSDPYQKYYLPDTYYGYGRWALACYFCSIVDLRRSILWVTWGTCPDRCTNLVSHHDNTKTESIEYLQAFVSNATNTSWCVTRSARPSKSCFQPSELRPLPNPDATISPGSPGRPWARLRYRWWVPVLAIWIDEQNNYRWPSRMRLICAFTVVRYSSIPPRTLKFSEKVPLRLAGCGIVAVIEISVLAVRLFCSKTFSDSKRLKDVRLSAIQKKEKK